ncbi:putative response regulator receiver protein [Sphingobium sp. SYK-6]|uniref:response regulator n=1 Tax=Sphingobium sp. (strain NBRC 103272 / SYK-6) TaxID=627192 RepID=UPI000227704E|nr:response regulator [Sphingobium sp. SYK-6]BAK65779.1 putative response regulator receiver protein [Sphingobium sp. SYK-6]
MLPSPVRILVVDDVQENLDALEALLAREDLAVVRARSGREALERLLVDEFALALLDVQMPGMDGFELAELMRGTERTRRIPIIFLTAVATDDTRYFRGYEAGAVDYLLKPLDSMVLRSKVDIFVELHRQRLELASQRDELASALGRLQAHRDNSPLAIVEIDARQQITAWSMGAERLFGWREEEMLERAVSAGEWLDDAALASLQALIDDMREGGKRRDMLELALSRRNGATLETECYCSALCDQNDQLLSINIQIVDVTERKRAENTRRLLVGELNHRVKNTLASVQAIASQTLRHSSGPSEFAPTFIGRIHALSKAHSLLSEATWKSASLRDLVQGQLDMGVIAPDRLSAEGPDVQLAPEPALHLAMVIHELATNAVKYGALSTPTGRVDLDWSLAEGKLFFEWKESGGPPVAPPRRTGFGSALIERSLRSEGGTAKATYDPAGLRWSLTLPCPMQEGESRSTTTASKEASAAAPVAAPPPASTAKAASRASGSMHGKSVLVVEDEPLVALDIVSVLSEAGASVIGPVTNKADALESAQHLPLDLVLLDGNLQGETVEDIAEALRGRNIPFLMVSGYGASHLPEALSQERIVLKPFVAGELLRSAEQMLHIGA